MRAMHPAIEPTRYGVMEPARDFERLREYRRQIDELSEFHRERFAHGLSVQSRLRERWSRKRN